MKRYVFILLIVTLGSCGYEEAEIREHTKLSSDFEALKFVTRTMVDAKEAEPGRYIVAFKSREAKLQASNEQLSSMRWLNRRPLITAVSSTIKYLGSLNLSSPEKSFLPTKIDLNPPPLKLNFRRSQDDHAILSAIHFNSEELARKTLSKWYSDGLIWYAEPNYVSDLDGALEQDIIQTFDDPGNFPWLDQLSFIDAMRYFDGQPATSQPVIAVMDSGVDVEHDALKDRIFLNESGQNILCTDDLYGCDTTNPGKEFLGSGTVYPSGTSGFNESCGSRSNCIHGTHVAGIIAAQSTEYVGICPYCKILVVKLVTLEEEGGKESFKIKDESILAGLEYVSGFTSEGSPIVRLINASFGKFQKSRSVGLFIEALKSFGKGVLVIAAAGNEDTMKRQYPAAFRDVLAVANVDSNATEPTKAPSSNFGVWVDIAAPGSGSCTRGFSDGILSSAPGQDSICLGGTSMSAPMVTGVAGLILASNPDLNYDELRLRLLDSAVAENLYKDGINNLYRPAVEGQELVPLLGGGIVNALLAVDTSIEREDRIFSAGRSLVKPGCGTIGAQSGVGVGLLWLIFIPLLVPCKRLIVRTILKR